MEVGDLAEIIGALAAEPGDDQGLGVDSTVTVFWLGGMETWKHGGPFPRLPLKWRLGSMEAWRHGSMETWE